MTDCFQTLYKNFTSVKSYHIICYNLTPMDNSQTKHVYCVLQLMTGVLLFN